MQDKLKQFVEDNRDEFEVHQPREHLWDGVDERLQQGRKGTRWQRLAIAASVLLAVTCGAWFFVASRQTPPAATVAMPPSIKDAEVYFTSIVQMKDAELEQYCMPQPQLCREFESDMAALSEAYRQLKTEYAAAADKEMILQAMTANLQMQVQLISRQLQIMESVKQKKEEARTI